MSQFNFGPAYEFEEIVFGAERPGINNLNVEGQQVEEWINFMKSKGIKRVVCLLDEQHLRYYKSLPSGLIGEYVKSFGENNILHAPIDDFHLVDELTLGSILSFLDTSKSRNEPVVIHCAAGIGRTGHILAAWLAHSDRTRSDDWVLNAVKSMPSTDRNPNEAGDLIKLKQLLEYSRKFT
jgi:protein-tyrosine phosphatase